MYLVVSSAHNIIYQILIVTILKVELGLERKDLGLNWDQVEE